MRQFVKYWLPLLIWVGAMFVGSTDLMSAEHTSRYMAPFLLWLKPGISPNVMWIVLVVVRKCAHMMEYAILAILLWRLLRSLAIFPTKKIICFGAVLLGCALFATSDEFHQTFVKSRTPSVRDVWLDITGAVIGLLILDEFHRPRSEKESAHITQTQFIDVES